MFAILLAWYDWEGDAVLLGTHVGTLPVPPRVPPGLPTSPEPVRELSPNPGGPRPLPVFPGVGGAVVARDPHVSFPVQGNDHPARPLDSAHWVELRR